MKEVGNHAHPDAHLEPLNDLVDRLRTKRSGQVPHIHPEHGGVHAPVLSVLSDPGKATQRTRVLWTQNPDPTSRRQRELMAEVGLLPRDLCPWNAYPWQLDPDSDPPAPDVGMLAAGAVVLSDVIGLMENLQVLLLQGRSAQDAWDILRAFRTRLAHPRFEVVRTMHPLGSRGNKEKLAQQSRDWLRVAQLVHG